MSLRRALSAPEVGRRTARLLLENLEDRLTPSWAGVPPTLVNPTNALAVTLNQQGHVGGTGVNNYGEVDYIALTAPTSGSYKIATVTPSTSYLDTVVGVFSNSGQRLGYNDDISSTDSDSLVTINLTAGTKYYVGITRYTGSPGGNFSWSIDGPTGGMTPPAVTTVDLVGAALSDSRTPQWGGTVAVHAVVKNGGTGSAGAFQVQWYLSRDAVGSTDDIALPLSTGASSQPVGGLGAGVTGTFDVSLKLPAALPSGWSGTSFYIVMKTDSAGQVTESNEVNNFGAAGTGKDSATLTVTAPTPPPTGSYTITVNTTGMSTSQAAVFQQAAARWMQVIVSALPSATYLGRSTTGLIIDASATSIDGVGGVLGQAGPDRFRTGSGLPYHGTMQFDSADLGSMQSDGSLLSVIEHEMGHVLGIGTIWDTKGLLVGAGTSNPRFIGSQATAAYDQIFGRTDTGVPVENTGGSGTADSHWRESVFTNELMTGWVGPGTNLPLSRVTIGSLADIGYTVNMNAADAFTPSVSATGFLRTSGSSSGAASLRLASLESTPQPTTPRPGQTIGSIAASKPVTTEAPRTSNPNGSTASTSPTRPQFFTPPTNDQELIDLISYLAVHHS